MEAGSRAKDRFWEERRGFRRFRPMRRGLLLRRSIFLCSVCGQGVCVWSNYGIEQWGLDLVVYVW